MASLYGGITEELMLRLFVFSSLAWLLTRLVRATVPLSNIDLWSVNIITAVLFGLAHLPATRVVMGLSRFVVVRALVLNGIPGLIFGWLYWRFGLEAAIISHFCSDIVIQLVGSIQTAA
jgi:membrane protease YdiL (CAAX protease family)